MKISTFKGVVIALALTVGYSLSLPAQVVGIGEATPNAKLDILSTNATGNALEVQQNATTNTSSASWIINNGLGRALNVQSLNTGNNIPAVQVVQNGTGALARGLEVDMAATTTGIGIAVFQAGASDAIVINSTGAGWGIYNNVTGAGSGTYNDVDGTGFAGTVNDLSAAGGIGSYTFLNGQNGTGFFVDAIGDGWGLDATVNTQTATSGGFVYGATVLGLQTGLGHGALINHTGAAGRGVEFNVLNANNPDPAIFSVSTGIGSSLVVQNQNNAIPGVITVADITYAGTDLADHVGVTGRSVPAPFWGIGVCGEGGWYGIYGVGGFYAVYAQGDMGGSGLKNFIIDHPTDPANKFLRHTSIESDEVLNVYRGIVELDASGQALVELPDYFASINRNFSYQLTPIGTGQQPFVAEEITGNAFKVAGAPNTKVSWMVLAERNDAYLQQNPEKRTVEFDKPADKKGYYLMPELYGQPEELRIGYSGKDQTASPNRIAGHGQGVAELQKMQQDRQRRNSNRQPFTEEEEPAPSPKQ